MFKDPEDIKQWDKIVADLSLKFADGDQLPIDSIIYLIGVQELGKGVLDFSKDDKINLMHIAVCKLLEPFGYYRFTHKDKDAWPHYQLIKELPQLNSDKQMQLMQKAIIKYFEVGDQNE